MVSSQNINYQKEKMSDTNKNNPTPFEKMFKE